MSHNSKAVGTSFREISPYVKAMGAVVDAARELLQGTGNEAILALKLREYDKEEQVLVPREAQAEAIAYEVLSRVSYPG